jgi:hypothetical protein
VLRSIDRFPHEVRAELDKTRNIWLRGHRDIFGFAYLTLGVP